MQKLELHGYAKSRNRYKVRLTAALAEIPDRASEYCIVRATLGPPVLKVVEEAWGQVASALDGS